MIMQVVHFILKKDICKAINQILILNVAMSGDTKGAPVMWIGVTITIA